ncbi:MAG: SEC-C metal-binding domain-containing protein [Gammaproteobacteria bacterium]
MKTGRNQPCPCGSGLKYKQCCLKKGGGMSWQMKMLAAFLGLIIAVTLIVVVIQAIGSARNPDAGASGKRVWSEEHQHWHYE